MSVSEADNKPETISHEETKDDRVKLQKRDCETAPSM